MTGHDSPNRTAPDPRSSVAAVPVSTAGTSASTVPAADATIVVGPPPVAQVVAPVVAPVQYRTLQADRLIETAAKLQNRIGERFPQSSLRSVAGELHQVACEAVARTERIRRPYYAIRLGVAALIFAMIAVLVMQGPNLDSLADKELRQYEHYIQSLEATLGSIFFLGATIAFLMSVERRWKRERLLAALRELRALAHVVDMHQLTKDPQSLVQNQPTRSSPQRTMTSFELGRYLDYCSEMLSVIAKVGAIYVQEFPDPIAVEAADQVATLTNDLSRNIWQKIRMLEGGDGGI